MAARLAALAAAAAAVGASGGMSPTVSLEGTVGNFDSKTVEIRTADGRTATVPRDSIPSRHKIRTGERAAALLDSGELLKGLVGSGKSKGSGKKKQ